MTEFNNKQISVIGAARSGMEAARVLARLGANALLSDSKTAQQLGTDRVAQLEELNVPFVLGADTASALPPETELVVTSPGVPKTAPVLQAAVQRGIPVWSEIELAYRLTDAPIIAVTGTNGKTTTTLLIAHILQAAGWNALVAGNISADEIKRTLVEAVWEVEEEKEKRRKGEEEREDTSLIPNTEHRTPNTCIVAEISSFQLEWVETFAPHIAVLTNITPDHLNRHASFEEYVQTKLRIFAAQTANDWAIVNWNGNNAARIVVSEMAQQPDAVQLVWFGRYQNNSISKQGQAGIEDGFLTVRLGSGCSVAILREEELPPTLPGEHSIENCLAASAAALAMNAPPEVVANAIKTFPGVAHRMEFVADVDNVRYINNSMCTNVAAADSSLRAMDRPTVAIMGGADKELEYAPLVPALHEKARAVVLIGQVADKMETTFRAGGYTAIYRASTLEAAVALARLLAGSGEAVLLLPACASFDMFRDFEARGVAFRKAVHALMPSKHSASAVEEAAP